jgi:hypothetical protein
MGEPARIYDSRIIGFTMAEVRKDTAENSQLIRSIRYA